MSKTTEGRFRTTGVMKYMNTFGGITNDNFKKIFNLDRNGQI
jgi:hypothetical protein